LSHLLKDKKNVCLLLFDGMGQIIMRKHLSKNGWLRKQYWGTITSTFPSTTAAATNAFLSGKYPIEIGWFGWAQYFKEHDLILELFTGKDYLLQKPAVNPSLIRDAIDYQTIFDQIKTINPKTHLAQVWPDIRPGGAKNFTEFFTQLDTELNHSAEKKLIYGYWLDPDKTLHRLGVSHPDITQIMVAIEKELAAFTAKHPETTFIVFADHGLLDITFLNIQTHPDLYQTLMRSFSLEPRAATFYVKPNQTETFKRLFKRYYGRYFNLWSKEKALKKGLYGLGKPHKRTDDFLGDFIAVSKSKYAFTHGIPTDTMPKNMKAHHAGMTKKEMLIDVMVIHR
jgi:predicted AlkP superfamily pyrophosphatase or phosphodiesterase